MIRTCSKWTNIAYLTLINVNLSTQDRQKTINKKVTLSVTHGVTRKIIIDQMRKLLHLWIKIMFKDFIDTSTTYF